MSGAFSSGVSHKSFGAEVDASELSGYYDIDQATVGIVVPTGNAWVASNLALTANRAHYCRFVPAEDMIATSIGFAVTVAAASDDNIDVAIYNSSKARLNSSGATGGKLNSTGVKSVAITATSLTAGSVYWAGISPGTFGGSAASCWGANIGNSLGHDILGADTAPIEYENTAHVLPATATFAGLVTTGVALAVLTG